MSINKRIRKYREKLGWSQSYLAQRAGITNTAISHIESGFRPPSLRVIKELSSAFCIDPAELIDDKKKHNLNDKHAFFLRFGLINKLSEDDKKLIMTLAKKLAKNV